MTHQKWLEMAERIDSLRLFPRIIMIALFWLMASVIWYLIEWYTHLPTAADRTAEASGFAAAVVLTISGLFKMALTDYLARGRDWNNVPPSSTSTTLQSTTVTGTPPTVPPAGQ